MLGDDVKRLTEAGFSGLYIHSWEVEEAHKEIVRLCSQEGWAVQAWDAERGVWQPLAQETSGRDATRPASPTDPLKPQRAAEGSRMLVLLHHFHRLLDNSVIVQALFNRCVEGKALGMTYCILSPVVKLPLELDKCFRVVEHKLPDNKQLQEIANNLLGKDAREPVEETVLSAARGLTRREAEDAYSLSLLENDELNAGVVWTLKSESVKKQGVLSVYRGAEGFDSLGGLDNLKSFARRLLRPSCPVPSRGVLLLGAPGVGKSAWAKALGNEVGRPTLVLDPGKLFDKHVGESESKVRQALDVADAMSPAILFIDEVEKGLAGSTGDNDSGVASRIFGSILTWMSDHKSDVFCVLTCNSVERLPPEFSRAERLDGIFYIDLPTVEERLRIWEMYRRVYDLPPQENVSHDGWTGAEIKSCCRLAKALDLSLVEAAQNVVPVSISSGPKITALREYAKGRCLSASYPGVYTGEAQRTAGETPRRRINKNKGDVG